MVIAKSKLVITDVLSSKLYPKFYLFILLKA